MFYEVQSKEVEVEGTKVDVKVNVVTTEDGTVHVLPYKENDVDFIFNFHQRELEYFLENEKSEINRKIEEAKNEALKNMSKVLNKQFNLDEILEMMHENSYEDYVGYDGSYEKGIRQIFDICLDDRLQNFYEDNDIE